MYEIIDIPAGAAQLLEQLGNKYKFWFQRNGCHCMFKEGRTNTGEDWAEKVVAEICQLLDVPCAVYHFGKYADRYGVITESIVPRGGRLIHGNELLARLEKDYDAYKTYHHTDYTVRRVLAVLRSRDIRTPFGWSTPEGISSAPDVFVGYLMIDALVANQDRHHQNWGLVALPNRDRHLAHTFDHAASLGRNESDDKRAEILTTKDMRRHISSYVKKAKSAFFSGQTKNVRLSTVEAFNEAQRYHPEAAKVWLHKLAQLTSEQVRSVVDNIPETYMSPVAKTFACAMISQNQQRLLNRLEV